MGNRLVKSGEDSPPFDAETLDVQVSLKKQMVKLCQDFWAGYMVHKPAERQYPDIR